MLRTIAFCVAASGLVASCAQAPEPQPEAPDPQVMIAAANALDRAFVEAFNEGDAEALSGLYWNSPDVVSFPPDTLQVRGIEAIKTGTLRTMGAMKGAKVELTEIHQMPAGDVVIGWGLFRMSMPAPDGTTVEIEGRFTDVKALRNGRWVYLVDHASVPMPPPAATS
jgi:ketosteroid isomerase-like protein